MDHFLTSCKRYSTLLLIKKKKKAQTSISFPDIHTSLMFLMSLLGGQIY